MKGPSIFELPNPVGETETFLEFFRHKNVTIEGIVSSGRQPSQKYVQDHEEWVLLVSGHADMKLGGEPVSLEAGDTLHLPAGVEHEVVGTSEGAIWLAVHVR